MNLHHKKKWILLGLLFSMVGLLAFNSCSNSSTDTEDGEDGEDEELSALIYLSGTQIMTQYSAWPIPENDEPSIDTTRISFLMKIHSLRGEEESIRIYGLEGADVGKRDHYLFPNCKHPDDCKVIGRLSDEVLKINIGNNGRTYKAEGNIFQTYDPYVEMTATYKYQNTTIDYELEGGIK